MRSSCTALAGLLLACGAIPPALAAQEVVCARTEAAPVIDGRGGDAAWSSARPITTADAVASIEHELRCVHDGESVYLLVRFPDADENREHKTLLWDADQQRYRQGPAREDTLVLKWSMEPHPVDISLSADAPYKADVWYWKSVRTDHAGVADDKVQLYSAHGTRWSKRLLSKSGRIFHLRRSGDAGRAAYAAREVGSFMGEAVPAFVPRTPEGSRADVRARGTWHDGRWEVEFARKLDTGHDDDVHLDTRHRYVFGVSRYEIAGRAPEPDLQIPEFGAGEVGEALTLRFE